ncbi:uncharacterized protein B0H18DRAFT_937123 [Fomitopsis serialis]|uniref:uncharacterized protein n=1 Tax=Fomitopsis serialis TaxID=139415 RepID=UPI00200765D7|nr:uncharacterized protein B0H18DRAFT_937123 [Neoantrodia serialis]KAH9919622.1 hypothetical protein B0H18DRAFT_937123 [Neoantrodia serialis]
MAASEEVYAKELFKCGKGYPLWQPEATEDDIEIELGDVGYLDKGGFCRLFNALRDKEDPLNNKPQHVPDGFERFTIDMQPKRTPNAIGAGPLLSRTVKRVGGKAEAVVHGAKAGFEFECVENQGACVVVGSSAARAELHQARRMKAYMKKNIDSWVYYATEVLGMDKRLDEVLFVRGWVKTTHWAVAAFVERAKNAKVSVSGGLGAIAEVGVGLVVETSSSSVDHHTGPGAPRSRSRRPAPSAIRRGRIVRWLRSGPKSR